MKRGEEEKESKRNSQDIAVVRASAIVCVSVTASVYLDFHGEKSE